MNVIDASMKLEKNDRVDCILKSLLDRLAVFDERNQRLKALWRARISLFDEKIIVRRRQRAPAKSTYQLMSGTRLERCQKVPKPLEYKGMPLHVDRELSDRHEVVVRQRFAKEFSGEVVCQL